MLRVVTLTHPTALGSRTLLDWNARTTTKSKPFDFKHEKAELDAGSDTSTPADWFK